MKISISEENFKSFMADRGYFPPHLGSDREFVRFNRNGKKDKSAWCVRFDDPSAGAFGDWRTGEKFSWSSVSEHGMTSGEREAFKKRIAAVQEAARKAQEVAHAEAAEKARAIWEKAVSASPDHPYLRRKGIGPMGDIRQYKNALVVPVRSLDGQLHSLQFIGPDGKKRFLKDGKIKGTCAWIKGKARILVCEGWATAVSLYMATGYTVVCAFNAGNLGEVVEKLWAKR